jgi:Caspase domain
MTGHGGKIKDESGDEKDGYDETLVPLDYNESGMILDDDLYEVLVKQLPADVHLVWCVVLIPNPVAMSLFHETSSYMPTFSLFFSLQSDGLLPLRNGSGSSLSFQGRRKL